MPPKPSITASKETVFDFLKLWSVVRRIRRLPVNGFDYVLGLSSETIQKEQVTLKPTSLTYRIPLAKAQSENDRMITPALATALMDNTSTQLLGAKWSPPGASICFQTTWKKTKIKMQDHEYLDIVNTITKTGRILAHIRTEYITSDQQLIGHSTHIKYLPTGNFFMDTFVQYYPPWQSPWLVQRLVSSTLSVPATTERPEFPAGIKAAHQNIQDSLKVSNDGHAEFTMTHEHTNALGALHGGAIAMVMEQVATPIAANSLLIDNQDDQECYLESLEVSFLKALHGSHKIKVVTETIDLVQNDHVLLKVMLLKPSKSKRDILAQGIFKFSIL